MPAPLAVAELPAPHSADAEYVRVEMERMLASAHFKSSRRCQTLLKYLVERTLAGESASLKERTIGVDVFGRTPDYDTSEDPVVRTTAGEVRKKIAQFYQETEHAGGLRIELHPGAYVPEFHIQEVAAPPPAPPVQPPDPRRRTRKALWIVAAAAPLAAVVWLLAPFRQPSEIEKFWSPVLTPPGDVFFCLGQPRTYNLRSDAHQKELESRIEGLPRQSLDSVKDTIPLNQLIPMWDRYIAVGDTICLLKLASVLEKRGRAYSFRSGPSTSFSDLREHPTILIGAFNNEWTLRAMEPLRYTFYKDFHGLEKIRDRDHPEKSDWLLMNSWPNWDISTDYAIVSRVLDHSTDRVVVIAAGITQYGTAGAGEFLSNPSYFSEAVSQLPKGWQRRNLQIVLSVPVVHRAAGRPRVLATHVW